MSDATRNSAVVQYQSGVDIGKNMVANKTADPATAYAPERRMFMCGSSPNDELTDSRRQSENASRQSGTHQPERVGKRPG